jgi:hypothetical protein
MNAKIGTINLTWGFIFIFLIGLLFETDWLEYWLCHSLSILVFSLSI